MKKPDLSVAAKAPKSVFRVQTLGMVNQFLHNTECNDASEYTCIVGDREISLFGSDFTNPIRI